MDTAKDQNLFDKIKAEAFSEKLLNSLNYGALSLMISIGHRTGLFDAMRSMPTATSEEVAKVSGLNERYVREWLGAMVTAGVIDVDSTGMRYTLPQEHAAFLTRSAGADNLAVFAQYIGLLGSVEDKIVDCFKKGGGVPYDNFLRFHAIMAEDSGQSVLSSLESHVLPLVPGLVDGLFNGIKVLDIGCGRGRIINRMAELYPKSQFVGLDISVEAIGTARAEASQKRLQNVVFEIHDLSNFDETAISDEYDLITAFDAIHDQVKPLKVLKGINRALKPNGVYLMQDIRGSSNVYHNVDHPIGTFLYTISTMHCMTVSLSQGGEGLGAMWGEEKAHEYLEKAGFKMIETNHLAHDIQNNWYVVRKST